MATCNVDVALKFQPELLSSETLLWSGRPNPKVIFHSDDWQLIPFSLVWTGFFVFWEGQAIRTHSTFMILWGLPFLVFGQYFVWGRFLGDAWLKRRTYYGVTNRRVLVLQESWKHRTNIIYIETIPTIEREGNGTGTLWFGTKYPLSGARSTQKRSMSRFSLDLVPVFADIDDMNFVYSLVLGLKDKSLSRLVPQ